MTGPPPEPTDPPSVRAEVAERYLRLARDPRLPKADREELRRMALSWARTLPNGPEKDRILSLDGGRGIRYK